MRGVYTLGLTLLCCGLVLYRQDLTQTPYYRFMFWNLFLAYLPLLAAAPMVLLPYRWRALNYLLLPPWLIFFPNAPYMLSDLMHVYHGGSMPFWYDPIMLFCGALSALFAGFISLDWVFEAFDVSASRQRWWSLVLWPITALAIYLGRILRWNSWDLWLTPQSILKDVIDLFVQAPQHGEAWGLIGMYTLVLTLLYGFWRAPVTPLHSTPLIK